jgi:hypothetical protein
MSPDDVQAITAIASSLTTNAVLLLWLWREMRQADHSRERLEAFHDREREGRLALSAREESKSAT